MSKKAVLPPYVVLEKKRGETPLSLLQAWQVEHPEFANVPLSYAGRLDPMAKGKMLVLIGDECKKQSLYTKLDKEYEIEVLIGLTTDTGDGLGFVTEEPQKLSEAKPLSVVLNRELGSHSRRYPAYSSKTVNGKPLFLYALEGTLRDITIPEHIETIYQIKLTKTEHIRAAELRGRIQDSLSLVPRSDEPSKILGADFRQDEVRTRWNEFFAKQSPQKEFTILHLRVTCASGVYMRSLAKRIGTSLGSAGLALSINRTKIGRFIKTGPIGFWTKEF